MNINIITKLSDAIGHQNVLTGTALEERYVHIWDMHNPLSALCLVTPRSTSDVSKIMKICHQQNQPVVIHGGLTNLVGSTETQGPEVVISMEKMNQVEEIDIQSRTMTVQAGVILQQIQTTAKEHEFLFPLNFGAKGSAQIGGIIATNAGGLRVFKFGMTRNQVLGLEAVLADGTVISSMKKIIKDNSGYDLKQLFIGSEGTLGIVTRAVLRLTEAPKSRASAFAGINDYEKVVQFLKFMDAGLAGNLSGFELIWKNTFQAMTSPPAVVSPPLPYDFPYYVLLESLGADQAKDQEVMENLLGQALEQSIIEDAVIASNESDLNWFWTIREDVHVFVGQTNNMQGFDISLPIPLIGEKIDHITNRLLSLPEIEKVYAFGHVADGNIHLIIGKSREGLDLIHEVNEIVYGSLKDIGGSISAEHGIGVHKKSYLPYSRGPEEISLMKTLKRSLDPKNILNPGKVIDTVD